MKTITRLFIATIALLALASCGQNATAYDIAPVGDAVLGVPQPPIINPQTPEKSPDETPCIKPQTPIIQAEVTFVHPNFILLEFSSDHAPDEFAPCRYMVDFDLEQYTDGIWQDVALPNPFRRPLTGFIYPRPLIPWEYAFTYRSSVPNVLSIGQYRIRQTFRHYCACGQATYHDIYIPFAITEELDKFELHLRDIRQHGFTGEIIGFYSGMWPIYGTREVNYEIIDEIPFDAMLVRFMFSEGYEHYEGTSQDWLINRTFGVSLNNYIASRDANGALISPTDIPIGSIVNVRHFPFHRILEGYCHEPIDFHILSTSLIEIIINP